MSACVRVRVGKSLWERGMKQGTFLAFHPSSLRVGMEIERSHASMLAPTPVSNDARQPHIMSNPNRMRTDRPTLVKEGIDEIFPPSPPVLPRLPSNDRCTELDSCHSERKKNNLPSRLLVIPSSSSSAPWISSSSSLLPHPGMLSKKRCSENELKRESCCLYRSAGTFFTASSFYDMLLLYLGSTCVILHCFVLLEPRPCECDNPLISSLSVHRVFTGAPPFSLLSN